MKTKFTHRPRHDGAAGFSIVEALFAMAIATTALTAVASLFVLTAAANQRALRLTRTAWLAAQKIEQLRSAAVPDLSPPDALERDVPGCVDYIDPAGGAVASPNGAMYVRRWSVAPSARDSGALILKVAVLARGGEGTRPLARVMTVRRRDS